MIGLALIDPSREMAEDEGEQPMIRLGFWPRQGFTIYTMCKNFFTGRVTSYLILRLMERYGGYMDLCRSVKISEKSVVDMEERHQEQSLPGKRYTIRYWAPDPGYASYFSCWWEKEVIDEERLRRMPSWNSFAAKNGAPMNNAMPSFANKNATAKSNGRSCGP
jgi:hypothetical protein